MTVTNGDGAMNGVHDKPCTGVKVSKEGALLFRFFFFPPLPSRPSPRGVSLSLENSEGRVDPPFPRAPSRATEPRV